MNNISAVLVLCCIFFIALIFDRASKQRRLLATIPPCYTAIPLLGNLFNIPNNKSWETYTAWGRELNSGLISVWAPGGQLMIIVNSAKAARELLSHRSSNYVDRPRLPVLDLSGQLDKLTSIMPYGEHWRAHRRYLHRKFNLTAVSVYESTQDERTRILLQDLYLEPEKIRAHLEYFTTSLALMVAYGYRILRGNDEIGDLVLKGVEMMASSVLPGAFAVNVFPALKYLPEWLPGTSFHGFARKCEQIMKKVREEPYNKVKTLASLGQAPPSFTKTLLEQIESPSPLDESIIQEVASMVYVGTPRLLKHDFMLGFLLSYYYHEAGAETSSSAIRTIILALALNPDVQRRAQAEIDAVVGRHRLPVHSDKDRLPYIEAIIREALRWRPVLPLGLPRRTIKDDVYENMFIPAGATLTWNSWAITHDPDVYPEPDVFRPERYLDSQGQLALDEDLSIFGYGRRECVGMHLARSTLFLATASVISVFDLGKAKDENGNDTQIQIDYTDGLISHPKDYNCSIRPRDEKAVKLLDMIKSSSD